MNGYHNQWGVLAQGSEAAKVLRSIADVLGKPMDPAAPAVVSPLRRDVARLLDNLYGLHCRPGHVDAVLEVFTLHAPVKVAVDQSAAVVSQVPAREELIDQALRELQSGLAAVERESFIVNYSVIGRGAGGLASVVDRSTAMHALLFPRATLRKALLSPSRSGGLAPDLRAMLEDMRHVVADESLTTEEMAWRVYQWQTHLEAALAAGPDPT